jgi:ring-1,2-phenylacetyl-CoA epoxidase subunit PaaD
MTEAENRVKKILSEIPDPEIPVITIEELGVIRSVNVISPTRVEVNITPTYSGCPAMKQMEDDIVSKLKENGFETVKVNTVFSPPWTTDWISDFAKEKLRKYGIAPPENTTQDKSWLMGVEKSVTCPRCRSKNTKLISQFGSTACKALHQCQDCLEPFDYFKCI